MHLLYQNKFKIQPLYAQVSFQLQFMGFDLFFSSEIYDNLTSNSRRKVQSSVYYFGAQWIKKCGLHYSGIISGFVSPSSEYDGTLDKGRFENSKFCVQIAKIHSFSTSWNLSLVNLRRCTTPTMINLRLIQAKKVCFRQTE